MCVVGGAVMVELQLRILRDGCDSAELKIGLANHPLPDSPSAGLTLEGVQGHDLRDSLWYFDGSDMRVWIDMQDVLASASAELGRDLPTSVQIPVDFYPLSALINKAIIFGIEPELIQRRDTSFAFLRFATRVCHARQPITTYAIC